MQDLTSAFADGTLFIDGTWGPASSGRTFEVTDPATGEVLAKCDDGDLSDTQRALDAAERAQVGWARTTAYERAAILERAERLMRERAEDLATLMVREQGKPLRAARNEVQYGADFFSWFAGEARRIYGSTIPSNRADQRFLVLRQPVGVVAAVTPWNYPISMITRKVGPALAAGCTVVLKPAKQTPLCAAAVVDILREAGLPDGVVNMVTTNNSSLVVDAMLESSVVRKLTFTGSTEIGKILGRKAADGVKRVSLELGGHAPFIVFGDADATHAAKGAAALKFLNAGQACICPNRIYVQRELVDEFLDTMVKRVGAMRTGNGLEDGVAVGPLIDAPSLEKMERQVSDATAKGAKVLVGGERLRGEDFDRGQFFAPTVLTDVTPDMEIYTEETFGPIAPVIPFDDEDEVVRLANDTTYGLASYLYTNDLSRALRVSEQLQFGIVGINDVNPTSAAAPFGGIKESGLGREGGATGIDEYLDIKLIGISL
jgi:succinate-semialdehyde dehydrogenase/glutarate-semialdehyde dehydrogenase